MSSTWLCSRNDLIANVAVLAAAVAGVLLLSRWPDILVGVLIASLFLGSALGVLKQSVRALRVPPMPPTRSTMRVAVGLIQPEKSNSRPA
jgi:Co/Zn/Cd efflux system component|nr:hypothetical protein [uncultured Lamprocystis sp.]